MRSCHVVKKVSHIHQIGPRAKRISPRQQEGGEQGPHTAKAEQRRSRDPRARRLLSELAFNEVEIIQERGKISARLNLPVAGRAGTRARGQGRTWGEPRD
jgi:hypothetical protein